MDRLANQERYYHPEDFEVFTPLPEELKGLTMEFVFDAFVIATTLGHKDQSDEDSASVLLIKRPDGTQHYFVVDPRGLILLYVLPNGQTGWDYNDETAYFLETACGFAIWVQKGFSPSVAHSLLNAVSKRLEENGLVDEDGGISPLASLELLSDEHIERLTLEEADLDYGELPSEISGLTARELFFVYQAAIKLGTVSHTGTTTISALVFSLNKDYSNPFIFYWDLNNRSLFVSRFPFVGMDDFLVVEDERHNVPTLFWDRSIRLDEFRDLSAALLESCKATDLLSDDGNLK